MMKHSEPRETPMMEARQHSPKFLQKAARMSAKTPLTGTQVKRIRAKAAKKMGY